MVYLIEISNEVLEGLNKLKIPYNLKNDLESKSSNKDDSNLRKEVLGTADKEMYEKSRNLENKSSNKGFFDTIQPLFEWAPWIVHG